MGTALSCQEESWEVILFSLEVIFLSLLSWEVMLLSLLPITNDGAQQSNLLCLGWSALFPHCLIGSSWKAVPQHITYTRLWIYQGKRAHPKFLRFLSWMTEFPHSPSFLAHMCSSKKLEFFDCLLTEHCNYFLFPHIPFKQLKWFSLLITSQPCYSCRRRKNRSTIPEEKIFCIPWEPVTSGDGI